MKKVYTTLPQNGRKSTSKQHIGILGCGNFAFANIAYYIRKNYGQSIKGVMDIDINKAASLYEEYGAAYYTTNAEQIINDPDIDLIFIASNHASHAEYAIEAIKKGKAVHIEKPHIVSLNQLTRLTSTIIQYNGKVRLGFNRPNSKLGNLAKQALASQTGATMINWFVAGHEIQDGHWYFAPEEGGRVMGNLCHWTDLSLSMIPQQSAFPIKIIPTRAEKSDCDISVSYVFGDGSIATITFSAKGHTFEGVRETLNAHRNDILLELKDFQKLRIDNREKVSHYHLSSRDHGHELAVLNSCKLVKEPSVAESIAYIWNTGYLAIKTKEALDKNEILVIEDFSISYEIEKNK